MASKVKFKLNLKGLNDLMKSPAMQGILEEKGRQVGDSASGMSEGGSFRVRTVSGRWIATTFVSADDEKAIEGVYEDNVLLKALNDGK